MPNNKPNDKDESATQRQKDIAVAIVVAIMILLTAFSFGQSCLIKACFGTDGQNGAATGCVSDGSAPADAASASDRR